MKKVLFALLFLPVCLLSSDTYTEDEVSLGRGVVKKTNQPATGTVKRYNREGELWSEIFLTNGIIQKEKLYNVQFGKIRSETLYQNGKPFSSVNYYYHREHGTLREEIPYTYRSGKPVREGTLKTYYPTGELASESPYSNDKREGTVKRYYKSGTLRSEAWYQNDRAEGIQKSYDEAGRLQSETSFKDGKQHASYIWYWYDKEGNRYVQQQLEYIDGNPIPVSPTKTPPGVTLNEGEYAQEDTLYVEETGLLVDEKTNIPITGIVISYNRYGNVAGKTSYKEGKLDGISNHYHPDGSLYTTVPYVNGKRHGVYTSYHANGKIDKTVTFEHGMEKGTGMVYYENGNLEATITYQEDGTILLKQYDKNGTFKGEFLLPKKQKR